MSGIKKLMLYAIISFLILMLGIVMGSGLMYMVVNGSKQNKIDDLNKEITNLKNQISDVEEDQGQDQNVLEKENSDLKKENTKLKTDLGTANKTLDKLPNIVFSPGGNFTDTQKADLNKKLVLPAVDYYKMTGEVVVAMEVKTTAGTDSQNVYQYLVTIFFLNQGAYNGFVYGDKGKALEYWTPECFESICKFTKEYEQKHPETVKAYNKMAGV